MQVDVEGRLTGDEEHIGGFDLIYDNGYVEVDPEDAAWSTYLGTASPLRPPRPPPAGKASPSKGAASVLSPERPAQKGGGSGRGGRLSGE